MLAYEDIREQHEAGDDAATIAAAINAQGRTAADIEIGDLLYMLNFRGMLTKEVGNDAAKKWTGTILNMKAAVAADPTATLKINQWLSHVTNPRNKTWQTSQAEYAAPFYALYRVFNNPPNAAIFAEGDLDAIYELGGGRIETTAEEVQLLIDEQSLAPLRNRAVNASALMVERLTPGMSSDALADIWASAWEDAV